MADEPAADAEEASIDSDDTVADVEGDSRRKLMQDDTAAADVGADADADAAGADDSDAEGDSRRKLMSEEDEPTADAAGAEDDGEDDSSAEAPAQRKLLGSNHGGYGSYGNRGHYDYSKHLSVSLMSAACHVRCICLTHQPPAAKACHAHSASHAATSSVMRLTFP